MDALWDARREQRAQPGYKQPARGWKREATPAARCASDAAPIVLKGAGSCGSGASPAGPSGVNRHAAGKCQLDKVVDRFGQAWRER